MPRIGNPYSDDDDDVPPPLTAEEDDDDVAVGHDEDDDDDDDETALWNEGMAQCKDLFSAKKFDSAQDCLSHCKNVHGFNLKILKKRHTMDCFSFIRLINYLRKEQPSPGLVMSLSSDTLWKDQQYMKPTLADDPLLMVDIDEDVSDLDEDEESELKKLSSSDDKDSDDAATEEDTAATAANAAAATPTRSSTAAQQQQQSVEDLQETLAILRRQLELKNEQLEEALSDMDKMRNVTRALMMEGGDAPSAPSGPAPAEKSVSGRRTESEDSGYAGSYAHFGIHHEMLSDRVRTESYRDAVAKNVEEIRGKNVLDLGCGTGILSMFCARHGQAGKVVGVDMSSIAHQAMDIVMENGLENKVTVVKGRLEDTDLKAKTGGTEKFDVLISEWMGYFLLFEGMLDSVMKARDDYLVKEGGQILPNRCTMHLVGVNDGERYNQTAGYFADVYGFKMSCLRGPLIKEASIEVVPAAKVITSAAQIHELDMTKCTLADTEFEADFELVAEADGELTSIAGYFDTFFDSMANSVFFSTGPQATPTHWKQTIFYLDEKVGVTKGQKIPGKIKVTRPDQDVRALRVKISLNGGKPQKFNVE